MYVLNCFFKVRDDSPAKNIYFVKKDANGPVKFTFVAHVHADVGFCFENTLKEGQYQKETKKYKWAKERKKT